MRKHLLTPLALLGIAAAQTFTVLNVPVVGQTDNISYVDNANTLSSGASGSGATWDFSTVSDSATGTLTYIDPSTSTFASAFPTATLASTTDGSNYTVFKVGTDYELLGLASSAGNVVYYNSEKYGTFPIDGTVQVDSFYADITLSSIPGKRKGQITTQVDGTGMLILPGPVNISNVMRFKVTESYKDSVNAFGTPITIVTNTTTWMYIAYMENYPHFQLKKQSSVSSVTGATNTAIGFYATSHVVGMQETLLANQVLLYPNPAHSLTTVRVNISDACQGSIALYNSLGQQVRSFYAGAVAPGESSYVLDLSGISPGIYFLKMQAGTAQETRKLVIE